LLWFPTVLPFASPLELEVEQNLAPRKIGEGRTDLWTRCPKTACQPAHAKVGIAMPVRKRGSASIEDIKQEIAAFSEADLLRLLRFARYQVFRYPSIDPKEVLGESVARALEGRRDWPDGVPFKLFFCNVIRSVADELRNRARDQGPVPDDVNASADGPNPEEQAADRAFLASIWKFFEGDEHVRALLAGIEEELSAKEIQRKYNMSASEYGAALKRLDRKLAKQYPNGMKS
jgi:DNA-directed RNA polymerase specialized sigma24 family protein